jgi:hypothetical protein
MQSQRTLIISPPAKNILDIIKTLKIETYQKELFELHYLPILYAYARRSNFYAAVFHISRAIVTVGSITVPALLSLTDVDKWLTWSISLAVSICNGILTLFKIDKKYYSLHTTWRVLESEGWQYIALTGRYARSKTGDAATNNHATQFTAFCLALEKIRMAQVEDEYYKAQIDAQDKHGHSVAAQKSIVPTATAPKSQEEKREVDDWVGQMLDDANTDAKNTIQMPPQNNIAPK